MNKPRLKTLKSPLQTLPNRLQPLSGGRRPGSAAVRWTGRKRQEWRERILRMEPLCRHCNEKGITRMADEVDHIVPLAQGGDYSDGNSCPLCVDCHKAKTAAENGHRQRRQIGTDGWPVE